METLVLDLVRLLLTNYIHPSEFGTMMLVSKRFYGALSNAQKSAQYLKMWCYQKTIAMGSLIVTNSIGVKLSKHSPQPLRWREDGDIILENVVTPQPDKTGYKTVITNFGGIHPMRALHISKLAIEKHFRYCQRCDIVHGSTKVCKVSPTTKHMRKIHLFCNDCGYFRTFQCEAWQHVRVCRKTRKNG